MSELPNPASNRMRALAAQILHEVGRPEVSLHRVHSLLKGMTEAGDDRPAWLERENKITHLCLAHAPGLKSRKIGLLAATDFKIDGWEPLGEAIPDAWYDLGVCLKMYLAGGADPSEADTESVDQAALRLVTDALAQSKIPGLATILSGAPSAERASVEMIRLCESDESYYAWSADDWTMSLGVTKRIITGDSKNRILPCRGWSLILEWRAANRERMRTIGKPKLVP